MSKIIACPNCGQKNRIDERTDNSQAICAKCWTKLNLPPKTVQAPPPPKEPYSPPPSPKNPKSKGNGSTYGWLACYLVIGGVVWWVIAQDLGNSSKSNVIVKNHAESRPSPSYPEVALPYSGSSKIYSNGERVAPLKIQTAQGANYLVKLVSLYSQQPVMTVFVQGGNTVSTEVPLGTYEIKYASGVKWYGYEHLFGPDTGYSKAESLFTFKDTGNQISGYTITLYRVSNGNLRTSTINPEQF